MIPDVTVDIDLTEYRRRYGFLLEKHIPYGVARTLTRLAVFARDREREQLGKRFTLRNTRTESGIRSSNAQKRDWPAPFAEIGSIDRWMVKQELGENKVPRGDHLAFPTTFARGGSERGSLKKRMWPGQVLKRRRTFVNTIVQGKSAGKEAILQRVGADRYPLRVAYLFATGAHVPPRWDLAESVERIVSSSYARVAREEFESAMLSDR